MAIKCISLMLNHKTFGSTKSPLLNTRCTWESFETVAHLFIPGLILADECEVVELFGNIQMVLTQSLHNRTSLTTVLDGTAETNISKKILQDQSHATTSLSCTIP